MGAGLALYVPSKDLVHVVRLAELHHLKAFAAGHIENGDKKVVIEPKNLEYKADTLGVR